LSCFWDFVFFCISFLRSSPSPSASEYLVPLLFLAVSALLLLAAIGMQRRKQYGRWLGVLNLCLGLGVWLWAQYENLIIWPTQSGQPVSGTRQILGILSIVIFSGFVLLMIFNLALVKKVTTFFNVPSISEGDK